MSKKYILMACLLLAGCARRAEYVYDVTDNNGKTVKNLYQLGGGTGYQRFYDKDGNIYTFEGTFTYVGRPIAENN